MNSRLTVLRQQYIAAMLRYAKTDTVFSIDFMDFSKVQLLCCLSTGVAKLL